MDEKADTTCVGPQWDQGLGGGEQHETFTNNTRTREWQESGGGRSQLKKESEGQGAEGRKREGERMKRRVRRKIQGRKKKKGEEEEWVYGFEGLVWRRERLVGRGLEGCDGARADNACRYRQRTGNFLRWLIRRRHVQFKKARSIINEMNFHMKLLADG